MLKKATLAMIAISLSGMTGCATTGGGNAYADQTYSKVAASGQSIRIYDIANSYDTDCTEKGKTTLRVISLPKHGTVSIVSEIVHPNFPASNPRSKCNSLKVKGLAAYYKSNRGYSGDDTVTLRIYYVNGVDTHSATANIKVE